MKLARAKQSREVSVCLDDKSDSLEEHALVMEKEGVVIPLNDIGQVIGLARGVCSMCQ